MMKYAAALCLIPTFAFANPQVDTAVQDHILPRFATLVDMTEDLVAAGCDAQAAWEDAAEAWIAVSHLRFGPTEVDNRAFSLAFWPDPRGTTPKTLHGWLAEGNLDVADASIAGRGFYAMEFLAYDEAFWEYEATCDLIAALAEDIHTNAVAIESDWAGRYAALIQTAGNDIYRDDTESLQELYKAVGAGLEFTIEQRLGRPLGTFARPRPTRAEMRRSGRSLANVATSLQSLTELALILAGDELDIEIAALSERVQGRIAQISDVEGGADLSLVGNPGDRFKVEALQQDLIDLRTLLGEELGPQLGVIEGFNSLDGD